MRRFIGGLVVGLVMSAALAGAGGAKSTAEKRSKDALKRTGVGQEMAGWVIAIQVDGVGYACDKPFRYEKLKTIACMEGWNIAAEEARLNELRDGRAEGKP